VPPVFMLAAPPVFLLAVPPVFSLAAPPVFRVPSAPPAPSTPVLACFCGLREGAIGPADALHTGSVVSLTGFTSLL
jgi:hypothetical protein